MPLTELRQLEMKIAQKFGEYGDVYDTDGEAYGLKGMDLRTYFTLGPNPWAWIETIPRYFSDEFETRRMEMLLEKSEYWDEYHQILNAAGVTLKGGTLIDRLGYSISLPRFDGDLLVVSYWNDDLVAKLEYQDLDWEVADEYGDD